MNKATISSFFVIFAQDLVKMYWFFLATFRDISDYAILYLQPLWLVGTIGKNSQIPFIGNLAKTTAVVFKLNINI